MELIKGAKLSMVNNENIKNRKQKKNIGLTTIDMKKVEENKEELKVAIKETEKDIKELSKSDDELDRKLAKIFGLELGLYKTLINDKENNNE